MPVTFNISTTSTTLLSLTLIRVIRICGLASRSSSPVALRNVSNNVKMARCQEIGKYFEAAKKLALEAGEVFKAAVVSEKTVETKRDKWDLLTQYDNQIETLLVSGLSAIFPDHKFIAEESVSRDAKLPELTDAPTWFIDPIDGTTNFVHKFSQCCISIGLTVCKRLELGIIYNPTNGEMYSAVRGEGAFLNGKPIKTSGVSQLSKSLVNVEVTEIRPSKNCDVALARLEAFVSGAEGVRCIGSAALGLAYIASGNMDAFEMEFLGPWDVAAGRLIVEEAGGTVLDLRGGPHDVMKPKTTAAATESLAKEISKLIVETDLQTQRKRLKRVPSSSKLL